jgi:undecaprenyl diphosphate synthase
MSVDSQTDSTDPSYVPRHIAIIMDGNGRWARKRAMPRTYGHKQGAETVKTVVRAASELGVKYLTLYGFSTENWSRPAEEVGELMSLMRHYIRGNIAELHENGVRLKIIGERWRLAKDVLETVENAEAMTANNTGITLTIAFSYGGRQELVSAMQQLAKRVQAGQLQPEDIQASDIDNALLTAGLPDPDLLIRTSGEQRISNFLLWQMAYTEMVFLDTLWPDFNKADLQHAISTYQQRDRRYGKVSSAS